MATVLSTDESINAIQQMLNTHGALEEQLNTFIRHGDTLGPHNFDGPSAGGFYGEWPGTKSALQNASQKLRELADNILAINNDIQRAGGNSV